MDQTQKNEEDRICKLEKDLQILKATKLKASLELSTFLTLSEIEWDVEKELAKLRAKEQNEV